jgi:hypothetical protein
MPEASSDSIAHYPAFLARLPPGLDLGALGRETKAFRRSRGVRSATDLLRLALAWMSIGIQKGPLLVASLPRCCSPGAVDGGADSSAVRIHLRVDAAGVAAESLSPFRTPGVGR